MRSKASQRSRSPAIWTVQYKTAFVLAHKLREAMASELKGMRLGGDGETVEVDGGYFGGYVKPANYRENRRDRRLARQPDRQAPGRGRHARAWRFHAAGRVQVRKRGAGLDCLPRGAASTRLIADEAGSWNDLHARFAMDRIDHGEAYSLPGGVYTNGAEEFFSRMRRAEIGHHHHVAGPYLVRYAQESGLARGSAPGGQRPAGPGRHGAGDGVPAIGGLVRVLAARAVRLKPSKYVTTIAQRLRRILLYKFLQSLRQFGRFAAPRPKSLAASR